MISGNRASALRNVVHRSRRFMPSGTVQDIWSSFRPLLQDTNKIDAQEVGCQLSVHILCPYPDVLLSLCKEVAAVGKFVPSRLLSSRCAAGKSLGKAGLC